MTVPDQAATGMAQARGAAVAQGFAGTGTTGRVLCGRRRDTGQRIGVELQLAGAVIDVDQTVVGRSEASLSPDA